MTREIKFRAWNGKNMLYYNHRFTLDAQETLCFEEQTEHSYIDNSDVDYPNRVELMQYTWLKDKNWIEIYEGDILRHYFTCSQCDQKYIDAVVERARDWRYLRNISEWEHWIYDDIGMIYDWEEREVIGNIYENPELLNKLNKKND